MELIDYIDNDEGRDVPAAAEMAECESCGKAAASLTFLEGWNFFACAECVRECDKQEAECACQRIDVDRYDARGCAAHDDRRAA
jgi:hypothetical protein